jgi:hypothetical protein
VSYVSQCEVCRRYRNDDKPIATCDAYPAGIPFEILINETDHLVPRPGDHGLQFDPVDAAADTEIREAFAAGPNDDPNEVDR